MTKNLTQKTKKKRIFDKRDKKVTSDRPIYQQKVISKNSDKTWLERRFEYSKRLSSPFIAKGPWSLIKKRRIPTKMCVVALFWSLQRSVVFGIRWCWHFWRSSPKRITMIDDAQTGSWSEKAEAGGIRGILYSSRIQDEKQTEKEGTLESHFDL